MVKANVVVVVIANPFFAHSYFFWLRVCVASVGRVGENFLKTSPTAVAVGRPRDNGLGDQPCPGHDEKGESNRP